MTVPIKGDIVKEYTIGNTTIKISNAAYVGKTPADTKKMLEDIVDIGREWFRRSKKIEGGTVSPEIGGTYQTNKQPEPNK